MNRIYRINIYNLYVLGAPCGYKLSLVFGNLAVY